MDGEAKCNCDRCGQPIAFPLELHNTEMACPVCGEATLLLAPASRPMPPPMPKPMAKPKAKAKELTDEEKLYRRADELERKGDMFRTAASFCVIFAIVAAVIGFLIFVNDQSVTALATGLGVVGTLIVWSIGLYVAAQIIYMRMHLMILQERKDLK